MGRSQREKGARGECEVRDLLVEGGFEARRDGRLDDDLDHSVDGYHIEVKRREQYDLGSWIDQAEADANGRVPIVAFRKNGQPWRGVLDLKVLIRLLGLEADAREFLGEFTKFTNHPEGEASAQNQKHPSPSSDDQEDSRG